MDIGEAARQERAASEKRSRGIFENTANRGRIGAGFSTATTATPSTRFTPPPDSSFLGSLFGSVSRLPGTVANIAVSSTVTIASDLKDALQSTSESLIEIYSGANRRNAENLERNNAALEMQQDALVESYRNGRITKQEYAQRQVELASDFQDASKDARAIADYSDTRKRVLDLFEAGLLPLAGGLITKAGVAGTSSRVASVAQKALSKIPNVDDILRTRAQKYVLMNAGSVTRAQLLTAAGQAGAKGITKELALGYYLRYPLIIGQSSGDVYEVLEGIENDDEGHALWRAAFLASMAFKGGPLGVAYRVLGKAGGGARSIFFGREGMYDILGSKLGFEGGDVVKYLDNLKVKSPTRYKEAKEALEAMQEINLRKAGDNAVLAAENIVEHLTVHRGYNLDNLPFKNFDGLMKNLENYYTSVESVQSVARIGGIKGVEASQARLVTIGSFDSGAKKALIARLEEAPDAAARMDVMEKLAASGVHYTQNKVLYKGLAELAVGDDFAKTIKKLNTAFAIDGAPKWLTKELSQNGYVLIKPRKIAEEFVQRGEARKIVSKFVKKGDDAYDIAIRPRPVFGSIGNGLRKIGLSPEDTTVIGHSQLVRNVGQSLVDVAETGRYPELKTLITKTDDGLGDGRAIIGKLQKFAEDTTQLTAGGGVGRAGRALFGRSEVQDIRYLNITEIAKALDIDKTTARAVKDAITQGYLDVPLQIRGMGDRIMDINFKNNPLARPYARAQSALRYSWNPFFRVQEVVESEVLGQVIVRGKKVQLPGVNFVRNLFRRTAGEMSDKVRILEESGLISTSFFGEAAQDATIGRVSAVLSRAQKETLAGMTEKMAKARGMDFTEYITKNYDEVADALRITVQYSKRGALNSSLARTMNLAFFPVRYNLKVTKIAADFLATQPVTVQLATINGLFDMRDWIRSDEGLSWRADNRELVDIMAWITPVGSIAQVLELTDGVQSPAELGLIGGLPFGIITQMLDSQTEEFNLNTPFIDPKSGKIYPDYIPLTTRARIRTAVTDLLMSVYTYPGRLIGLPGKGASTRDMVDNFIPFDRAEYNKLIRDDNLTEEEQHKVDFLMEKYGLTSTSPNSYDGPTLPPGPLLHPSELKNLRSLPREEE